MKHSEQILQWALKVNGEALAIQEQLDKSTDALTAILVRLVLESTNRLAQFLLDRQKRAS